jgi:hypothetical protein
MSRRTAVGQRNRLPWLICLGRTRQHRSSQDVLVLQHAASKLIPTVGRAEEVSGGGGACIKEPISGRRHASNIWTLQPLPDDVSRDLLALIEAHGRTWTSEVRISVAAGAAGFVP